MIVADFRITQQKLFAQRLQLVMQILCLSDYVHADKPCLGSINIIIVKQFSERAQASSICLWKSTVGHV